MLFFSKNKTDAGPVICTKDITKELIEDAVTMLIGKGVRFSVFYANMCGYLHDGIDEESSRDFLMATSSEPNFTAAGREYAVNRLIRETGSVCNSNSFEIRVFGLKGDKNFEKKETLNKFKEAVSKEGFESLCSRLGFNVAEFLERETIQRRKADLEKIVAKFEDRKDYLKPILLRAISRGKNKYGEIDYGEYTKELEEFLSYYFPEGSLSFYFHLYPHIFCNGYLERNWFSESTDTAIMPSDGIDFEHWCADKIEQQGWAVRVSKCSGDQGVDIEAIKDDKTVAIQCKRYSQPIGNKAVQEAYSGMAHYNAHLACVIGTGGFTPQALELARSTGVILIDAENVSEFTCLVSKKLVSSSS